MARPAWALVNLDKLLLVQGWHRMLPRNSAMAEAAGASKLAIRSHSRRMVVPPADTVAAVQPASPVPDMKPEPVSQTAPGLEHVGLVVVLQELEYLAAARSKATAAAASVKAARRQQPGPLHPLSASVVDPARLWPPPHPPRPRPAGGKGSRAGRTMTQPCSPGAGD